MAEAATQRWLILVHQLPARPSNLRVRVWRRLHQVGAVVLRNSLYVLPSNQETREDFNWVREEIVSSGGQASILEAAAVDGYTDSELVQQFRAARNDDYHRFVSDASTFARARGRANRAALDRGLRRLRERLAAITVRDYFGASDRANAERALAAIEASRNGAARGAQAPTLKGRDFKGFTWVTRPRPGIDRMASAWLVSRFIAPDARFAFATPNGAVGRRRVSFDMPGVEFGHHGAHCTFETLMARFAIADPAVASVARVVHDLDLKETRYAMPECAAIGRLVDGLRASYADDTELLERGMVMIEALYQSFAAEGSSRKRRRTNR